MPFLHAEVHEVERLVLTVTAENAKEILSGRRKTDLRTRPPARLPARAYLAVAGSGQVVGQCELGEAIRDDGGSRLPLSNVKRYARPRPISSLGIPRIPRSFRYVDR